MGFNLVVMGVVTGIWMFVGVCVPYAFRPPQKYEVVRLCLRLTAFVCWLFWLCAYVAQANPTINIYVTKNQGYMIERNWDLVVPKN